MPINYAHYNQPSYGGDDYGWQFVKGRNIGISSNSEIESFASYDSGTKTQVTMREPLNRHRLSASDVIKITSYSPTGDTEFLGWHTVDSIISDSVFVINTGYGSGVDTEDNLYSFSIPLATGLADEDVFLVDIGNAGKISTTKPITALEMKNYFTTEGAAGEIDIFGTPVTNDFARWTDEDTLEGRSYAETKSDLSLDNVENTALSTWAGTTNITTTGTITSGTLGVGASLKGVTMAIGSDSEGDIYFNRAGTLKRLPRGGVSQVLSMDSLGEYPQWSTVTIPDGDGVVYNESTPISSTIGFEILSFAQFGGGQEPDVNAWMEISNANIDEGGSLSITAKSNQSNNDPDYGVGIDLVTKGDGGVTFWQSGLYWKFHNDHTSLTNGRSIEFVNSDTGGGQQQVIFPNGFSANGSNELIGNLATQTLKNKTLTAPVISDANDKKVLEVETGTAPVNYIKIKGGDIGQSAQILGVGDDADVGLQFFAKGDGSSLVNPFSFKYGNRFVRFDVASTGNGGITNLAFRAPALPASAINIIFPEESAELVGETNTQTLTNKTINSPIINSPTINTAIFDSNSNEILGLAETAGATNHLTVLNTTDGNSPTLMASGSNDTDISVYLQSKNDGHVEFWTGGGGVRIDATESYTGQRTILKFDIATATSRTISFPDGDGTLLISGDTNYHTRTVCSNLTDNNFPLFVLRNEFNSTSSYPKVVLQNTQGGIDASNSSIQGALDFNTTISSSDLTASRISSSLDDNTAGSETSVLHFGVLSNGTLRDNSIYIEGTNAPTLSNRAGALRVSRYGINQTPGGIIASSVYREEQSIALSTSLMPLVTPSVGVYAGISLVLPPTTYGILLECIVTFDASTSNRSVYADWTSRTPSVLVATYPSIFPTPNNEKKIRYPDETDDHQHTYTDIIKVSDMIIDPDGDGTPISIEEGAEITIYPTFKCSATNSYIKWGSDAGASTQYPPLILKATILSTDLSY